MRILMILNTYPTVSTPSAAPYIGHRVSALQRRGHEVRAIAVSPDYTTSALLVRKILRYPDATGSTPDPNAAYSLIAGFYPSSIRTIASSRLGYYPERSVDAVSKAVIKESDLHDYDVIHAHGYYDTPAGEIARRVGRMSDLPHAITFHGSDVNFYMRRRPETWLANVRAANARSFVSASLRNTAAEYGLRTAHDAVTPNGIDSSVFFPSPEVNGCDRLEVLFVGNLLEVKGADRIAEIATELTKRVPNALIHVAGDGPLRSRLEGVGGVILHGRLSQSDVASLMRSSSVLLVPSRAEGWPCVVLEGMHSGLPVVGTAVPGVVEAHGGHGEIVPDGEDLAKRLAESLISAWESSSLGREERIAYSSAFSWDVLADGELNFLNEARQQWRR